MNIIKFPIRLVWRRSKTQSQAHSYILQLPLEVLIRIFAFLPPYSQLLTYQTCRPLRTIIHQYFFARGGEILVTPKDRLHYLTDLARSLPDRWVCAKCCKLHQTCSLDTPSYLTSYSPECEGGKIGVFEEHSESRKFFIYGYFLAHRHVELTLKYTRLESRKSTHQEYLRALLAPHHAPNCQRPHTVDVSEGIILQHSYYPKVVDGRYLLFTIRTYLGVGATVSRRSIQFLRLCPHLSSHALLCSQKHLKFSLDVILHMAFSTPPGTPISYPCTACGTDVFIKVSPKRAVICTWQDLGPEGTVYDPHWEAIVRQTTKIDHEHGSIRELYGQHEHNGEIY